MHTNIPTWLAPSLPPSLSDLPPLAHIQWRHSAGTFPYTRWSIGGTDRSFTSLLYCPLTNTGLSSSCFFRWDLIVLLRLWFFTDSPVWTLYSFFFNFQTCRRESVFQTSWSWPTRTCLHRGHRVSSRRWATVGTRCQPWRRWGVCVVSVVYRCLCAVDLIFTRVRLN